MKRDASPCSVSAEVKESDMNRGTAATRGPIENSIHRVQLVTAVTPSENNLERAQALKNLTTDHSRNPLRSCNPVVIRSIELGIRKSNAGWWRIFAFAVFECSTIWQILNRMATKR